MESQIQLIGEGSQYNLLLATHLQHLNGYLSLPSRAPTRQVAAEVSRFVLQDAMVSQIILKQFHIIVHTILIRLLHQRAQLLLLSPRPRPYHQRVKIDARNRVLLRDIRQVTIDAQLERRQLQHAGLHLVMKLNLLPRISIRKKNVPSNTNTFGTSIVIVSRCFTSRRWPSASCISLSSATPTFITLIASSRRGRATDVRRRSWLYSTEMPLRSIRPHMPTTRCSTAGRAPRPSC